MHACMRACMIAFLGLTAGIRLLSFVGARCLRASRNTGAQIDRIAEFLGVAQELTPQKREAVIESVTFASMKQQGGLGEMLLRKGGYGDWKNHMGPAEWAQVDARFDEELEGVALAEPLRHYQRDSVGGFPPARAHQTLDVDPRQWPKFVRHTLVEGRLVRDTLIAAGGSGSFQRPPSEFNATVMPAGTAGAKHEAEAGRYHLFVSGGPPMLLLSYSLRPECACVVRIGDTQAVSLALLLAAGAGTAPLAGGNLASSPSAGMPCCRLVSLCFRPRIAHGRTDLRRVLHVRGFVRRPSCTHALTRRRLVLCLFLIREGLLLIRARWRLSGQQECALGPAGRGLLGRCWG